MLRLLLFAGLVALALAHSKPYPSDTDLDFSAEENNGHHHRHQMRHSDSDFENDDSTEIESSRRQVSHVGRTIKAKDFGVWSLFTGFIERYERTYKNKHEILKRFRVYKRNTKAAKMWQDNEMGTAVYGETQFMDLTPKEFRETYLPYTWQRPIKPPRELTESELEDLDAEPVPDTFDWRKKGAVTKVKNQEACGSCWAFSVTGNIEGQWFLKTNKLVSLSEQELLDCDVVDQACNGGLPLNAYQEIIRLGGLETEEEYPYDAEKEPSCKLEKSDVAVYINSSLQLPKDEDKMVAFLFKSGPISIVLGSCSSLLMEGRVMSVLHRKHGCALASTGCHFLGATAAARASSKPLEWVMRLDVTREQSVCGFKDEIENCELDVQEHLYNFIPKPIQGLKQID
ncbi:Papain family cysteine protease [Aphelenchoides bicaudatus]|nr:Papain family cysteine protease [Aphelenchoides bicaudatus]